METSSRVALPLLAALAALPATVAAQEPDAPIEVGDAFSGRSARRADYRDKKVLKAVDAGIGWLKSHQEKDGHWDPKNFMKLDPASDRCDGPGKSGQSVGITALAMMALLAQGDPLHHDACHRAADWIAKRIDKNGRVPNGMPDFIYGQALATIAMAEAAAILGTPRYRDAAQRAINYLESHRTPGAGWRYQPKEKSSDTSVLSWCMSAYFAGGSIGLDVKATTVGEAIGWLDSVTNYENGHTGYTELNQGSARKPGDHGTRWPIKHGHALTASGLHARLMAGLSPRNQLAIRAADLLTERLPKWGDGSIDFYYWLQGSISMEQLAGTPQHKEWRKALHAALVPNQCTKGSARGSWDAIGPWCEEGGRVYATAVSVLALSSDYRFGPTNAMALIPKTPAFRRIANAWRKDRIGDAAKVLRKLPEADLTAREKAAKARLEWYVTVEEAKVAAVLASLDKRFPTPVARVKRLQLIGSRYKGLPVGDQVQQKLKTLLADPGVANELAASAALAKLQKDYQRARKSSNRPRKRSVAKKLKALANKYPGTAAAAEALELANSLARGL